MTDGGNASQPIAAPDGPVDIVIVGGAGHVGLPLAISFACQGQRVIIHDIDEAALEIIGDGRLPAMEFDAEPLLKKALGEERLFLSSDAADVRRAASVIITVGTPVDEFLNPVHKEVKSCIDGLLPHLSDGQLLVMRSTVFPGTSDWLHRYLEAAGKSLKIAFCPERVVQGYSIQELRDHPQIISGTTPEALEAARALFTVIAPETVELEPMEAEFAKLFNNAHRYIQFAIANQFYMIADAAGIDYYRVPDAMTHNYPRAAGMASAGLTAGPCLVKDTMQLAAFARNRFSLGHAAMLVNEGLVLHMIERMGEEFPLNEMTVGLLGMAFKADSDDIRASLSYKFKKDLAIHAKKVLTTDPHVTTDPDIQPLDRVLEESDLLVLCVPHGAYEGLDTAGKPVIDVWNFLDGDTSAP